MSESKKPLTRKQVVDKISFSTGVSKKLVEEIIVEYENMILYDLAVAHEAKLGCIGKIKIKERAERPGTDLSTGESVIIPAKLVPKFLFSKGVKEYVANKIKK